YPATVAAARGQVARICQLHAAGNGTVRALLLAAANAHGLQIDAAQTAAVRAARIAQNATAAFDFAVGADADLGGGDAIFHSRDLFWPATFLGERALLLTRA